MSNEQSALSRLLVTKPLDVLLNEAQETGEHSLKRALGPVNLITLGIGAIIGAGIFVLTGAAAANYAGPAIMLSFVLAGLRSCSPACATRSLPRLFPLRVRRTPPAMRHWASSFLDYRLGPNP